MSRSSTIEALKQQIAQIESVSSRFGDSDSIHVEPNTAPETVSTETEDAAAPRLQKKLVDDSATRDDGGHDGESARAFKKIIDLVNAADRSEKTLRERLARLGFSEASIDESIERARSYGFVDDMRFAEVLIRSRISQRKGSAGIERELVSHGIDPDQVDGWPDAYVADFDNELDSALSLLDAKPPRSKNLRDGAYRKLMQRGFPTSVASSAARMWAEQKRVD